MDKITAFLNKTTINLYGQNLTIGDWLLVPTVLIVGCLWNECFRFAWHRGWQRLFLPCFRNVFVSFGYFSCDVLAKMALSSISFFALSLTQSLDYCTIYDNYLEVELLIKCKKP